MAPSGVSAGATLAPHRTAARRCDQSEYSTAAAHGGFASGVPARERRSRLPTHACPLAHPAHTCGDVVALVTSPRFIFRLSRQEHDQLPCRSEDVPVQHLASNRTNRR